MQNDEVILIRKKQSEHDSKIGQLENCKQRILELEQNPIMKEYYELKKFLEQNTEESIKTKLKSEINKILLYTKESNKILYDYGEVLVETYEGYSSDENEYTKFHIYRDLETTEYYFEVIDSLELIPPEWRIGCCTSEKEYWLLRDYFIEQIQNEDQEFVISKLLNQNKKLIKFK